MSTVEAVEIALEEAAEPRARRGRNLGFTLSVGWLVLVISMAVLAPVLPFVGDPYAIDALHPYGTPSWSHIFGTDELGRDIFTRCVYGAQLTFLVCVVSLSIAVVVGGILGLLAGFWRGWLDSLIMACTEVSLAVPGLVLLLAILAFLGTSVRNVIVALAIFVTPGLVRVVRAGTIQFSERPFVMAARTVGSSSARIMIREILPNLAPALASISLLVLGALVIAEGGLSFLGMGVPPPRPTWGGIIASGINVLRTSPHVTLIPAALLFVTVLSFNVIGEEIRMRVDKREARL
jgi:peptide/nickel transport system permease protein